MKLRFSLLPAALLLSSTGLRAETVIDIASGFEKQKIAAIESYLEKNPDAKDIEEAVAILAGAHMTISDFAPIPDLLAKRYALLDKTQEPDLGLIVNEIVRPHIHASLASSQRDKAKEFLAKVQGDFSNHPEGPRIAQFLDQLGSELYLPAPGDVMEIAFTDLQGNQVDLAKMKGKVVLVDFWATWCGPCVAEMPNVIAAYEKYHEKGFEVIGISLDEEKASVEAFVTEKKMPWPQHFDGKGWEGDLVQKFGIKGIPATFLVGKDGKVVAANLRGEDLEKAVEAALAAE
ncbi:MAG TPA: TlpA disulfide reductase family protein [Bacteroidia bacterium]|nr:TlpA disulfide reductase family protein [Bacteroidia bacterium]